MNKSLYVKLGKMMSQQSDFHQSIKKLFDEKDVEITHLKQLLADIVSNSKLVLEHQYGQERRVLEEIVYIIEKQQST